MKKILYFVFAAIVAAACVEEQLDVERVIKLSQTEVKMGAQGSVAKIVYQVTGAETGAVVTISEDADWMEVSTLMPRIIEITATRNESGADRQAVLTVSYEDYEEVTITVSQSLWEAPITLTIEDTDATSVFFSV